MSKTVKRNQPTQKPSAKKSTTPNNFYFGKTNYKFMLIGLALIALGLILMLGKDANTTPEGVYDPNYWNEGIFSVVRIRIAPLLIIAGFGVQVYAILKRNKA